MTEHSKIDGNSGHLLICGQEAVDSFIVMFLACSAQLLVVVTLRVPDS